MKNPRSAISRIVEFLIITNHPVEASSLDRTMNSIKGGRTRARTVETEDAKLENQNISSNSHLPVLQTDPIKLKSRLKLGTSLATAKVTKTIAVRKRSSPNSG